MVSKTSWLSLLLLNSESRCATRGHIKRSEREAVFFSMRAVGKGDNVEITVSRSEKMVEGLYNKRLWLPSLTRFFLRPPRHVARFCSDLAQKS